MKYYSTNKQAPVASLEEAVVKGLAGDKGLYMPEYIDSLDEEVIANMKNQSFHEIACTVAQMFFGEDIEPEVLDGIVKDTLSFETPVVPVKGNIYSLELFHGPTLAFKDVGGRFMARLLGYFIKKEGLKQVNVLVATISTLTLSWTSWEKRTSWSFACRAVISETSPPDCSPIGWGSLSNVS